MAVGLLGAVIWSASAQAQPPVPTTQAPPAQSDPAPDPGGVLPPPPAGAEPAVDETPEDQLTEDQLRERRMLLFKENMASAAVANREQRFDDAVRHFTEALKLLPGDADALLGRAEARHARTPSGKCPRRALSDLLLLGTYDPRGRWVEQRAVALQWMTRCGAEYRDDRLALTRELAAEDPGSAGRPDDIRFQLARLLWGPEARVNAAGAREKNREEAALELQRYEGEQRNAGRTPVPAALKLLGDLYRDADLLEEAIEKYRAWGKTRAGDERRAADKLVQSLRDEVQLREWGEKYGGKPTPEAAQAFDAGVAALANRDLVAAERHFDTVIELSEWYPKGWYRRGLVHAENLKFGAAVEDLRRATDLDRSYFEAHLTLGMIYKEEFGGTADDDARTMLETALRLRPDLHQLHLLLGELWARTDKEQARRHYKSFLERVPLIDPDAEAARQALDELDRTLREDDTFSLAPPPEDSMRFLDPVLQKRIDHAYLMAEQQNWARAETILRDAREHFPDEPAVLNALATHMLAQRRYGDARTYWEQSLEMDGQQSLVHEHLGLLLMSDLPQEALPHLRQAANQGSLRARYNLALQLWEQADFLEAYEQLNLYRSQAGKYELYWKRATALHGEMEKTFLYIALAAGILLFLVLGVPGWRLYRRYRGSSLAQLLERHPKSFPEVARVLSLIRHEILKHNTAFLADVGRALELDTADAENRALTLSRRLFGEGGPSDGGRATYGGSRERRRAAEEGGIYGRFLGYVEELDQVARSYGEHLNLYRKDPIFRPMLKAFEDLAGAAAALRDPHALRASRKLDLARRLGRAGHVLGRQAFERLSGLIRELCLVDVDPQFLSDVYARVLGEEQFSRVEWAPLDLSGEGARVRIFRTDLEDVLVNVIRNSLRSTMQYGVAPVGLGISLETETDDITGLSSLAIRIKDRSTEKLSNEMLRGRYVERGMGITVDLLSRYDGSIGVEPEPGWEKAVVLRFFTLEEDASPVTAERMAS